MAYERIDYDRSLRFGYYVFTGLVLTLFVAFVLFRTTEPNPANSKAFGCYSSPGASPILLNQQGMKILQAAPLQLAYHLERQKTGIALTADEPIAAEPSARGYIYSIRPPGIGWYLPFFTEIKGGTYGVFNEDELSRFTMLARDGAYLAYRRSPDADCSLLRKMLLSPPARE